MTKRLKFLFLQIYGYWVFRKKVPVLGMFKVENPHNIKIGKNVGINFGVYILAHTSVVIGDNVVLSANCMLIDTGLDTSKFANEFPVPHIKSKIVLEDFVWVGAGAIVLSGVTVGQRSIIAAGAVVTRDVPSYCIVAGNPAKVVKFLK